MVLSILFAYNEHNGLALSILIVLCMVAVGAISKFWHCLPLSLFVSCWGFWHEYPILVEWEPWILI